MKKILLQLDTEEHPSPFDAIVAHDADVDVLLSHGNVKPEDARPLAQGGLLLRRGTREVAAAPGAGTCGQSLEPFRLRRLAERVVDRPPDQLRAGGAGRSPDAVEELEIGFAEIDLNPGHHATMHQGAPPSRSAGRTRVIRAATPRSG